MSPFLLSPAAPWGRLCSIFLSEVEQEQRPSGTGAREAIVVGAGLCDGEGERAYTGYAPRLPVTWLNTVWLNFLASQLALKF